jgi:hypothetical protein
MSSWSELTEAEPEPEPDDRNADVACEGDVVELVEGEDYEQVFGDE